MTMTDAESLALSAPTIEARRRLRVAIRGAVQGVGFRPFVFRLAAELGLTGWVRNGSQGIMIEAEGPCGALESFLIRLERERPSRACIQSLEPSSVDVVGDTAFEIRESVSSGSRTALMLPDIATCPACLAELRDPANRRYRYPFTNCTNCGPRFSILEALPYDRPNTTMSAFAMCAACRAEYEDPADRRFHAQPNACAQCGPHAECWDADGRVLADRDAALLAAADAIRRGAVVAVKGLGGFHLLVDARNEEAVSRLRRRKGREEKPFALLYPSLEAVTAHAAVSVLEARLLQAPESPIVLLRRKPQAALADSVAPGNPYLGALLPSTPLHHLLMAALGMPVVATSGNRAEEPICIDEREALERLRGIAACFLVHNRPIARHVDDSVVRVMMGRELMLRRARGYAPLPVAGERAWPPVLAVGAQLKNAVAMSVGASIVVSQHIGDLETPEASRAFERIIDDFSRLYEQRPTLVACDAHPDYRSSRYAERLGARLIAVQHHEAHVRAGMADNGLRDSALGVAWDGGGYGRDGSIWGGEFLRVDGPSCQRVAHWRTFRLPGGEQAVREPRRAAIGLLYELAGPDASTWRHAASIGGFTDHELALLGRLLARGVNSPLTSSVGRLFDAVAAILGVAQRNRFEGQAAMQLEWALEGTETDARYPVQLRAAGACDHAPSPLVVDWAPMINGILADREAGAPIGLISAAFHHSLVEAIIEVARRIGEPRVVLSGGCFQNRYLTERAVTRLRAEGFHPYWHQRIPPNDGGIAVGQIAAAAAAG